MSSATEPAVLLRRDAALGFWLASLSASGYLSFLGRLAVFWGDTFLDWFETFLRCWWVLNKVMSLAWTCFSSYQI